MLHYCHTSIFVNNVMIKYFSLLEQVPFSLWCTTLISMIRKRGAFCYSLTLLPYSFQESFSSRIYSERREFDTFSRVYMKYYFIIPWCSFTALNLTMTNSPCCLLIPATPGFNHLGKGEVNEGVSHLPLLLTKMALRFPLVWLNSRKTSSWP